VDDFKAIKGFLNLSIHADYWFNFLLRVAKMEQYGTLPPDPEAPSVMVEFSSPNTNKPLHLGHIRNNLLGYSVSKIIEASGKKVIKVNLVNDRGIHICKSMLAWKKFSNGETPETSAIKGDHLVGKYYVGFDKENRKEIDRMVNEGMDKEQAEQNSPLIKEARDMLLKWEQDDPSVTRLWEMMNKWVYEGFEETYRRLGVEFDRIYYESNTYKLGKDLVLKGLEKGVFYKKEDGSVWVDLSDEGMDNKLLLRADGTSVYITQDLGTARQRFDEYTIDRHIYVVGNEQNYHFQVLVLILKKLGYAWADKIFHLSYGMVELPEGKMKSREGTVVDADDIIDEMISTARDMSDNLGKLAKIPDEDKEKTYYQVGLAALKYFILKVDPRKNMTFNPEESIDFNGNTGPFIQYTYARIRSVLRKAGDRFTREVNRTSLSNKEIDVIKMIYDFPSVISTAANELNPSILANYLYDVAREFNQFYHDHSILSAEQEEQQKSRLLLSYQTGEVIRSGMTLLGIEAPERM